MLPRFTPVKLILMTADSSFLCCSKAFHTTEVILPCRSVRFISYILCGFFLLGCGKKETSQEVLKPSPTKPAHSDMNVFQKPGLWVKQTSLFDIKGGIFNTASTTKIRWALNGRCQLIESRIESEKGNKYSLVVNTYRNSASKNKFKSTWFQDDGLVFGFVGDWNKEKTSLNWEKSFPPPGADGLQFNLKDVFSGTKEVQTEFSIKRRGFPLKKGESRLAYVRELNAKDRVESSPVCKELARIGKEGLWKDSQSLTRDADNKTQKISVVNRMSWSWGGRCLINEGLIGSGEEKEHFLWVKTYDPIQKMYRYAYFFEDGAVYQYLGKWDPVGKKIRWASIFPPGVAEISEHFLTEDKRTYTLIIKIGQDTFTGQGVSEYMEE